MSLTSRISIVVCVVVPSVFHSNLPQGNDRESQKSVERGRRERRRNVLVALALLDQEGLGAVRIAVVIDALVVAVVEDRTLGDEGLVCCGNKQRSGGGTWAHCEREQLESERERTLGDGGREGEGSGEEGLEVGKVHSVGFRADGDMEDGSMGLG